MGRIAVVSFPHTRSFFGEMARATAESLRSMGHTVSETAFPGTPGIQLEITFGSSFKHNGLPLWPRRTDRKSVHFNMEQLPKTDSEYSDLRRRNTAEEIGEIARRVDAILDTSPENVAAGNLLMKKLGLRTEFTLCPIGYHEVFDHSDIQLPQVNDVLFIGLLSDRRKRLLGDIRLQARVVETQSLFGMDRHRAIAQSKVNLNLHVTDHGFLESLRLVTLFLSSGRFCVSEEIRGWSPFKDGEHYLTWNQKDPEFFRKVLVDDPLRSRIGKQGRDYIREKFRYAVFLERVLKGLGTI